MKLLNYNCPAATWKLFNGDHIGQSHCNTGKSYNMQILSAIDDHYGNWVSPIMLKLTPCVAMSSAAMVLNRGEITKVPFFNFSVGKIFDLAKYLLDSLNHIHIAAVTHVKYLHDIQ